MSRVTAVLVVAMYAATNSLSAQQDSIFARTTTTRPWSPTVIEPDSLDRAAFTNVAELLQARIPGLSVTRRGSGAALVYLRGPASVYGENAPLLVVDGMRVSLARTRDEMFDGQTSPLDDIDVEQVERIEVLPGSAAATEYGMGAANGVIRITTRQPYPTSSRWRVFAAAGALEDGGTYPANFSRTGTLPNGQTITWCTTVAEARGTCTPTGPVTSFNPIESEGIISPASLMRVGGGVVSGSELLAWSGGATLEREGSVTDELGRQRMFVRGAVRAQISNEASLSLRVHWMDSETPFTIPTFDTFREQALISGWPADKWPGFIPFAEPERDFSRRGLSLSAEWRTTPWLRASVFTGLDHSAGTSGYENTASFYGEQWTTIGYTRERRRDFVVKASAAAEYGITSALHGRAVALADLVEHRRSDLAEQFYGSENSSAGEMRFMRSSEDIAGFALEHEVAAGERAMLRLGMRLDDVHSDFGLRWKTPWFPHASFFWTMVGERTGLVGDVRLRAAYAKLGGLPSTDHLAFVVLPPWESRTLERKVEVVTEKEVGVDATFLSRRAEFAVAWYSKRTTHMLTTAFGRPDFGAMLNRGVEVSIRAGLVRTPAMRWDVRAWYAYNHNEMMDQPFPEPLAQTRQWLAQGAPVGAYARHPIVFADDLDGDGVLESSCNTTSTEPCEVRFGEPREYLPAFPPTQVGVENTLRVGSFTLGILADHRRGHYLHNVTELYRCGVDQCAAAYATSPSREDAIRQASIPDGNFYYTGVFVEPATFTKLREISIRADAPSSWAHALGGRRVEVTLAGRNLATWTDYEGLDPEASSYDDTSIRVADQAGAPLPRSVSLRLTLVH